MAFCTKCGKEIEEGAKFCPSCGAAVSSNEDNYQNFSKVVVDEKISPKSKIAAGLLQIFLGSFGIGRFYTGHIGLAVAQLIVSIITCSIGGIWGVIDGIVMLCSNDFRDSDGLLMK